jgi:hypothetical protein
VPASDSLDKYFGGAKGAAAKAKANMQATYGRADGEHVFHATVAKRKRKASQARKRKWFG